MISKFKVKRIAIFIYTMSLTLVHFAWAQKEIKIEPYTIQTTYEKFKKDYPYISPITDLPNNTYKLKNDIVYKTTPTSKLKLDIYSPRGSNSGKLPVVMLIHGGGWISGSKENQHIMAQGLAQNGYIAVTPAYRLSREAQYPAGVVDLKDAIRFLRQNAKKYHINPDKIAVLGASAGAQLATLIGVTANSEIYKETDQKISSEVQAIVNLDGIVSFIHPEASAEGQIAGMWLGGMRDENPKNWKQASPLEYVDATTPPTLFINSSMPRFHAGRDDMLKVLDNYDIYNEVHTLEDAPHSFWLLNPWFKPTLGYTVAFLNKVFKD